MSRSWFNLNGLKMIFDRGRYKEAKNKGSFNEQKVAHATGSQATQKEIDQLTNMYKSFSNRRN